MPDLTTSSFVDTFMAAASLSAMRTAIGISFTQSGSAALTQSGNFTLAFVGTGNATITFPATSGTLATIAGAETLANKTLDSPTVSDATITNGMVFAGGTSGQTVILPANVASGTLTLPAATDTLVGKATTDTLTNKTLVAPVLGVATCTSINGLTITSTTGNLDMFGNWEFDGTAGGGSIQSAGAFTIILPTGSVTLYGTGSGTITSAQLATSLTNETGTGVVVFNTSPTLVTPVIGAATGTSLVLNSFLTCAALTCDSVTVTDDITSSGGTISTTGIVTGLLRPNIFLYGSNGAISTISAIHQITKSSAAAMTVAAPSSQDGELLYISSGSDFAHVVSFTGATLADGTTGLNTTVTFPAFAGASVTVFARGSVWYLLANNGCTIAP